MRKLTAILLTLIMLLSLASCSTVTPENSSQAELQPGYYLLMSCSQNGEITLDEDAASASQTYIQINADNTGVMYIMGTSSNIEWNDKQITVNQSAADYTLEGDILTIYSDDDSQMIFSYNGDTLPAIYIDTPVEPGYYIVSSVGEAGDVSYYSLNDPENGYVMLEEDFTGVMYFEGEEKSLTWDDYYFYFDDVTAPYVYYNEETSSDGQPMLLVIFEETETTVVLRPAVGNSL